MWEKFTNVNIVTVRGGALVYIMAECFTFTDRRKLGEFLAHFCNNPSKAFADYQLNYRELWEKWTGGGTLGNAGSEPVPTPVAVAKKVRAKKVKKEMAPVKPVVAGDIKVSPPDTTKKMDQQESKTPPKNEWE